jgi:uncharacterized membrane protein
MNITYRTLAHQAFKIGVILKGLDGLIETAGGITLLFTSKPAIEQFVRLLTHGELSEDPTDFVANLLVRISQHLSIHTQYFAGFYLLGYGIVKMGLAAGLLRGLRGAYPAAVVILTLFVAYQAYRITHTHSLVLMLLTLLDAVIVLLIFREWRNRSTRSQAKAQE